MGFLSDDDRELLTPSELLTHHTPIPTQVVSSDEYYPYPQTDKQRNCRRGSSISPTVSLRSRDCRAAASSRPRPAWPRPMSR